MTNFVKTLLASRNATYTEVERILKYSINSVNIYSVNYSIMGLLFLQIKDLILHYKRRNPLYTIIKIHFKIAVTIHK